MADIFRGARPAGQEFRSDRTAADSKTRTKKEANGTQQQGSGRGPGQISVNGQRPLAGATHGGAAGFGPHFWAASCWLPVFTEDRRDVQSAEVPERAKPRLRMSAIGGKADIAFCTQMSALDRLC